MWLNGVQYMCTEKTCTAMLGSRRIVSENCFNKLDTVVDTAIECPRFVITRKRMP